MRDEGQQTVAALELTEATGHQRRTWQRTLRAGLLTFEAAVVASIALIWIGGITPPFRGIFLGVILLALAPTLFWWAWMDEHLAQAGRSGRGRGWLRIAAGTYTACMLYPFFALGWHGQDAPPVPMYAWMMIWHVLLMVLGVTGATIWVMRLAGCMVRPRPRQVAVGAGGASAHKVGGVGAVEAARAGAADAPAGPVGGGQSRRTFLATAVGLVPVLVVGGAVAGGLRQQGRFRIRRIRMTLARLPERLRGLTITHVSDIHVGRLFRPEHLPALVEAVNALDSDLVAFTGDAVDHSFDYMPAACDALRQMRGRYGRFSVIGNHDLIDSPHEALDYMRRHELNFLEDACTEIDVGGQRLRIAGLSWRRYDRTQRNVPGYEERVSRMLAGTNGNVFTIALTHHPHAFDALAAAGADLTLAGHTHGGQIMLTPPGSAHPIGGGNLLFRYIWGEYRQGDSAMYVTSGAGNWFPVRINAPAEVVQIRLT
jgi:predicted MPP superfamily phosphohydrolase